MTQRLSDTGESKAHSIVRTLKVAMEENEGRELSDDKIVRTFLLIDVGAALKYLLRTNRTTSDIVGKTLETDLAMDTQTNKDIRLDQERQRGGVLSKLLLIGAIVGLGFVLRSRMESMNKVVSKVTDQAHSVANETARRSGEAAHRMEAVTGQVAEKMQEGGERAADQVQEGGQKTADQIDEAADTAEDTQEQQTEDGANEDE